MLRELRNMPITIVVLLIGISPAYPQSGKLPTVAELAEHIQRHDAQIHRGRGTVKVMLYDADKSHYDTTNRTTSYRYAFDGTKVRFSYAEPVGASVWKVDYIADPEKTIRVDSLSLYVWIDDGRQDIRDVIGPAVGCPFRWGPAIYQEGNWIFVGDYLHRHGLKVLGREAVDEDWCYVVEALQDNKHEKFWIDSNHGYRLRKYEGQTQRKLSVLAVQYVSVAPDVWFPQSAHEKRYDVNPETKERTLGYEMESNLSFEINDPLPEALFKLGSFNLRPPPKL